MPFPQVLRDFISVRALGVRVAMARCRLIRFSIHMWVCYCCSPCLTGGCFLKLQVQLRSPEEHRRQIKPSEDDDLTPEERAEREAEQQARKAEVARQLSGDFMEGWVNLAEWKSLRKVVPGRN